MADPAGPCPILVFGSGQRCGSTLVQRLLTSHPDVLIWGENGGHLRDLLEASKWLERWDEGVAAPAREAFEQGQHQGWIATLLPPPAIVGDAARAYLRTLFAEPAAAVGKSRWGFKEVRHGLAVAESLRELFPQTRVIHLTRDPRDVLISLDWWEREKEWWRREFTEIAVRDWLSVNESFLADERSEPWVESWRYEDLVADPDGFVAAVARLIEVDSAELDGSVFDRRLVGYEDDNRKLRRFKKLPDDLVALIEGEQLRAVAREYGYEL